MAEDKSKEPLSSSIKELNTTIGNLNKGAASFGIKTLTLQGVISELTSSIKQTSELQQRSLGVGVSIGEFSKKNSEALNNLPGGIHTALGVGLEANAAGIKNFSKVTVKLGVAMNLTNQNSKKMIGVQAKLLSMGQMDQSSRSELSTKILEFSEKFGVKADAMVGAISDFGDNLRIYARAGIAPEMTEAVAGLTAQMGEAFGPQLNEFVRGLTDSTMAGYTKLAMTGLLPVRDAFLSGEITTESLRVAVESAAKEDKRLAAGLAGMGKGLLSHGVQLETYGGTTMAATEIQRGLSIGLTKEQVITTKFNQSLEAFHREFLDPLNKLVVEKLPSLIDWLIKNKKALQATSIALAVLTTAMWANTKMRSLSKKWELPERTGKLRGSVEDKLNKLKKVSKPQFGPTLPGTKLSSDHAAKLKAFSKMKISKTPSAFGAGVPGYGPKLAVAAKVGRSSKLLTTLKVVLSPISKFLGGIFKFATKIPFIGKILAALGGPITAIVATVIGVVAFLSKHTTIFKDIWTGIKAFGIAIFRVGVKMWGKVSTLLKPMIKGISSVAATLGGWLQKLWDAVKLVGMFLIRGFSKIPFFGSVAKEFLIALDEMGEDIKTVADGTEKEEQRKDKEALAAAVNTNKYLEETRRSLNKSMMSALGLNDANKALAMEGNEHAAGQLAALGDLNTALAQIVINTERPDSGPAKRVEGK